MVENTLDNNLVEIIGEVDSELIFNHKVYGEGFYNFTLKVSRLSDVADYIPITVSERLLEDMNLRIGDQIEVAGQFRSYNNYNNEGNKLILTVFAKDINQLQDDKKVKNPNSIFLNGYICKHPIYRTTPFGREICDILLAVNRAYNKSDYIPCIAWGRNARYSGILKVGENIKVWGRIQSREYQKKINDEDTVSKVAYEVSISKMEIANSDGSFESDTNDTENDPSDNDE
ncbi:single-stranded DNA-binding protein [Petroclostridium sp. X23]|uniref:single-stranded DNA-binding protein n=1 Tax=Petroclostridium sp. X23 TaxID=3045146 RepID=UPI0024AD4CEC|nr:single-stranded DNA-binding protein [Petroclostridium sp. X23]WHH59018.1 single-stranded DNA-binding protein [Petroclostridium sp. X23]